MHILVATSSGKSGVPKTQTSPLTGRRPASSSAGPVAQIRITLAPRSSASAMPAASGRTASKGRPSAGGTAARPCSQTLPWNAAGASPQTTRAEIDSMNVSNRIDTAGFRHRSPRSLVKSARRKVEILPAYLPPSPVTGRKAKRRPVMSSRAIPRVSSSVNASRSRPWIMISESRGRVLVSSAGGDTPKWSSTKRVCGFRFPARKGTAATPATSRL